MKIEFTLLTLIFVLCLRWRPAFAADWGYVFTDVYPESAANAVKTDEIYSASHTTCAMEARKRKNSNLVCFKGDKCSFYDYLFCPVGQDEGSKPEKCWTKVSAPSHTLPCPGPFTEVEGVGCIYIINTTMTFDQGVGNCSQFCASLYVHRDKAPLAPLQTYLYSIDGTSQYWVGVRSRKWLDGRTVRAGEEWGSSDPNGPIDECARIGVDKGNFWIMDKSCGVPYKAICHSRLQ